MATVSRIRGKLIFCSIPISVCTLKVAGPEAHQRRKRASTLEGRLSEIRMLAEEGDEITQKEHLSILSQVQPTEVTDKCGKMGCPFHLLQPDNAAAGMERCTESRLGLYTFSILSGCFSESQNNTDLTIAV